MKIRNTGPIFFTWLWEEIWDFVPKARDEI